LAEQIKEKVLKKRKDLQRELTEDEWSELDKIEEGKWFELGFTPLPKEATMLKAVKLDSEAEHVLKNRKDLKRAIDLNGLEFTKDEWSRLNIPGFAPPWELEVTMLRVGDVVRFGGVYYQVDNEPTEDSGYITKASLPIKSDGRMLDLVQIKRGVELSPEMNEKLGGVLEKSGSVEAFWVCERYNELLRCKIVEALIDEGAKRNYILSNVKTLHNPWIYQKFKRDRSWFTTAKTIKDSLDKMEEDPMSIALALKDDAVVKVLKEKGYKESKAIPLNTWWGWGEEEEKKGMMGSLFGKKKKK